jgi:2-polyprenyl-6-methoxyphenol hydroxylase-like FAD-dependent oxidoreductase
MRTGVLALDRAGVLERIIAAGTPAIREVTLVFEQERINFPVSESYGVDAYFAPRRTVLDIALLDAAIAAGVTFLPDTTFTGITRDSAGRVDGIAARSGFMESQIRSRWVIGADGTGSRVARAVEAPVLRYHPPATAIVYAYFEGLKVSGYDFRFIEQRNVGAFPTNDGLTLAFVGGPLAIAPRDSERYLLDTITRLAPDFEVSKGIRVGRFHRSNGIPNVLRQASGPGWALVGDAGFTEDPISAHGITDALRDAELLAAALSQAIDDPRTERDSLAGYMSVRDRFAHSLLDSVVELAQFRWDGPTASKLMRQLGEVADAECAFLAGRDRELVTSL